MHSCTVKGNEILTSKYYLPQWFFPSTLISSYLIKFFLFSRTTHGFRAWVRSMVSRKIFSLISDTLALLLAKLKNVLFQELAPVYLKLCATKIFMCELIQIFSNVVYAYRNLFKYLWIQISAIWNKAGK